VVSSFERIRYILYSWQRFGDMVLCLSLIHHEDDDASSPSIIHNGISTSCCGGGKTYCGRQGHGESL
jgi:hypothetical protein